LLFEALALAHRRFDDLVARSRRELHVTAGVECPRTALRVESQRIVLVRLACLNIVMTQGLKRGHLRRLCVASFDVDLRSKCHDNKIHSSPPRRFTSRRLTNPSPPRYAALATFHRRLRRSSRSKQVPRHEVQRMPG